METRETKKEKILALAKKKGVIRPRDAQIVGARRQYLNYLHKRGLLRRVGYGLYTLPEARISEHQSLKEVATKAPRGIICLLSALRIHELTTQAPPEVWIAIGPNSKQPTPGSFAIRVVRFSGLSFSAGIELKNFDGVPVKIYNAAKTVADCFKFRNKIGLDVALEALRDGWRQKKFTMDELWKYAKICRVANVMKPYLESQI